MDRETTTKIEAKFFPYAISGCSEVKLPTPGSARASCIRLRCSEGLSNSNYHNEGERERDSERSVCMPDARFDERCLRFLQEQVTAKVQLQDSLLAH